MRPLEDQTLDESKPPTPHRRLELFYYERWGTRLYLRFTRLGVIIILLLTAVPLAAILLLFLSNQPDEKINLNVTVPSPSPYSPEKPILQPPPPAPTLPRVDKQSTSTIPALPSPLTSNRNSNEQILPKQTPQPTPSKPPP
jgi:hypothetical protein